MGGLFSQFGSGQRVGFGLALFFLSTLLAWLSLRMAVSGPWYGASLLMIFGAGAMSVGFGAWPDKLPAEVAILKEKWDKAKGKSTKSVQGRFVWKLGRSVLAMMLAFQFMPADIDGGFLRLAFVAGFGVSAGFFGAQAMFWSGAAVFLIAHRVALSGLNVDFSAPASREQLWLMWSQGASMSWWWAVGLGLCPLLWIGASGLMVKVGLQISEEFAERKAAAIAKKKIDARRERLRSQRDADASDPLQDANDATERAKKRASSMASRDVGFDDLSKAKLAGDSKELRGVAKLENDKNEILLRKYAAYAVSVMNSEKIGISADTTSRRAFDRVVQGLSDTSLTHLRSATWDGASELVDYYDRLCGLVQDVVTGGDGEIVSAGPGSDEVSLPLVEQPILQAEELSEGTIFVDVLDHPLEAPAAIVSSRAAIGEGTLKMMLSESSGSSDAVSFDDDSEEEEIMSADTNEASTLSADAAVDGPSPFGGPLIEDHGILGGDLGDGDGEIVVSQVAPDLSGDEVADSASADEGNAGGSDEPEDLSSPSLNEPEATAVEALSVDEEQLRRFAASIVMGKADREVILGSLGCFDTASALAAAIGFPVEMVAEQFSKYQVVASAARDEIVLANLLGTDEPNEDALRFAVARLAVAVPIWETEGDVLERGHAWIGARDAAIAERAAEDARLAEQREQQAREQAEKEQREREEAAQAAREAEERAAEEARLAQEKAEAAQAEQALREAEEARLAALNENKAHYVSRILVGNIDEEVLAAGMDLFPSVEDYAQAASLPIDMVEGRYNEFCLKFNAKSKYDELREAMSDESNLDLVQALIATPESFEGYTDPSLTLADAIKWVEGVEVKQRVAGLADGGIKSPAPAGENMRKLFMKKRLGTTDEQVDLIEKKLPEAITLERQLGSVLSLLPSADPGMVKHRARASAEASNLAAMIVANEKQCKEYAMAFFPGELRNDETPVWDMIVELAANAGAVVEAETAATESPAPVKPTADKSRANGALLAPIAFSNGIRSEEEVQQLDPAAENKDIEFAPLKSREDLERSFRFSYKGIFEGNPVTESSTVAKTFSVSLGEDHGHGKIVFYANLERVPLWYHEASDKILHRDVGEGNFRNQDAGALRQTFERFTQRHEDERSRVRGIIMISPYMTVEGEISFLPFIRKFQECPLIVINNERLNSDVFRAFVEKIKGEA